MGSFNNDVSESHLNIHGQNTLLDTIEIHLKYKDGCLYVAFLSVLSELEQWSP